jgi:hypothetical protein
VLLVLLVDNLARRSLRLQYLAGSIYKKFRFLAQFVFFGMVIAAMKARKMLAQLARGDISAIFSECFAHARCR